MTNLNLGEIEARANAASPGPWRNAEQQSSGTVVVDCSPDWNHCVLARIEVDGNTRADIEFIAHARDDVPALCAEVRKLEAEVKARELWASIAEEKRAEVETWKARAEINGKRGMEFQAEVERLRDELKFYASIDTDESFLSKETAVLRGEIGTRARATLEEG